MLHSVALKLTLLAAGSAAAAFFLWPSFADYTITLTDEGWSPEELTIEKGASVRFVSERGEPFWPASDLHPTHEVYSEFDARKPIPAHQDWIFRFDQTGRWRFHDHLAPGYRGKIIVLDENNQKTKIDTLLADCQEADPRYRRGRQSCWSDVLEYTLDTQDLGSAFELFGEMYKLNKDAEKGCHWWGHTLGERAFELYYYQGDHNIAVRGEAMYCGYGFFHGFIERLLIETGDFSSAFAFCRNVRRQAQYDLPGLYWGCMHGMGHGSMSYFLEDNRELWGQFQPLVDLGIRMCEGNLRDPIELEQCYQGLFDEMQRSIKSSEYGFLRENILAKDDPLWHCHSQKERHRGACYKYFATLYSSVFYFGDFAKAASHLKQDTKNLAEEYAKLVSEKVSADFMKYDIIKPDRQEHLGVCRTLPNNLHLACIEGIIVGLYSQGEPEREHIRALEFCAADYLDEQEREFCYQVLPQYLYSSLPVLRESCPTFPKEYQHYCDPYLRLQ